MIPVGAVRSSDVTSHLVVSALSVTYQWLQLHRVLHNYLRNFASCAIKVMFATAHSTSDGASA